MTLGRKIVLAFAIPVAFTLVTGGMSVVRMRALNETVQSLALGSLRGTNAVGRLAGISKDIRGSIRGRITATSDADKAKAEKDLVELELLATKEQHAYEATVSDKRDRDLFNAVPDALRRLLATAPSILKLSRDGKPDQAMKSFHAETMPAYLRAQSAIEKLAKFKELDGEHKAAEAESSVTDALRWTVGMLGVVVVVFLVVVYKLADLHQKNIDLGESEMCERERNLVLQLVSEDKPLSEVLAAIQTVVERQYPRSICAIRLVAGDRFTFGAPTRLPKSYVLAADRFAIHPPSSTCGLAVAGNETVFTPRIEKDPVFRANAADLLIAGLHSCLSVPISSGYQEVLGTIALFGPHQQTVDDDQRTFLERIACLAAVAIEKRFAKDQLAFQAKHDALTGLPNRVRLMEVLTDRISRSRQRDWAVVWVDLDRFKPINDALGHQVGDMLLQAVARRLRNSISEKDTVARIGGDEFVLVLDSADPDAARTVAARVVHTLGTPFLISDHRLVVTASVGVGQFPEEGATADEVLRRADLAMYQAKNTGKNSFCVFDPNLAEGAFSKLEIDHLVRSAVDRDEMWLVYQPQISSSGEIAGVEALLRWENPVLGVVSPMQFIPLAEENGSINAIGAWVLRSACSQAALWHAEGHFIRMSVNVSAHQFARTDFVAQVADTLAETGLSAAFLELEITETGVMRDMEHCVEQMRRIRELGVRIAIDDFGTGNSSLSYLKRFPIDTLKIDQSFVKDINDGGMPVVKAIMTLASSMGLATVAEGVEYEHQSRVLKSEGCELIQGYYYFPPMSAEALLYQLRQPLIAIAS